MLPEPLCTILLHPLGVVGLRMVGESCMHRGWSRAIDLSTVTSCIMLGWGRWQLQCLTGGPGPQFVPL